MSINAVIDLSHHNGNVDLGKAAADGIAGVIHKATQGTTFTDNMYLTNRDKSESASLLWGAYHFGDGSDAKTQADHFLNFVQPEADTLLVLDFEENTAGDSMTLDGARTFVARIMTPYWQTAGFGCLSSETRRWCPRIGPSGPCGNSQMARQVQNHTPSTELARAIVTNSTATWKLSTSSGKRHLTRLKARHKAKRLSSAARS